MVFNHYRFFISFNIPSYFTFMGIPYVLDVVVDCVICNLMCCLVKNTTKFRFFVILNYEAVMDTENWDVLIRKVVQYHVGNLTVDIHQP